MTVSRHLWKLAGSLAILVMHLALCHAQPVPAEPDVEEDDMEVSRPPRPATAPAWMTSCPVKTIAPAQTLGDPAFRHDSDVTRMAVLADQARMVTSGNDGTVRLWDLKTGKLLKTFHHKKGYVWDFAVLEESQRLLTCGSEGSVVMWDMKTGERLKEMKHEKADGTVFRMAVDSAGKRVAAVDDTGSVVVWDLEGGKALATLKGAKDAGSGYTVMFTQDEKGVIFGSSNSTINRWELTEKTATVIKAKDKDRDEAKVLGLLRSMVTIDRTTGPIYSIVPTADRSQAIVCCQSRGPWLMDTATGKEVWRTTDAKGATCAAWSPDGKSIAAVGDEFLWMINAADGSTRWKAKLGSNKGYGVAWLADGKTVMCGSNNMVVRFDASDGKRTYPLDGAPLQNGSVDEVVAVPGSDLLAECGGDAGVRLWDRKTGKVKGTYLAHEDVRNVAASKDGKKLLVSGSKMVAVLEADTGKTLRQWHRDEWESKVAFVDDGNMFVARTHEGLAVRDVDKAEVIGEVIPQELSEGEMSSVYTRDWAPGPGMQVAMVTDGAIFICTVPGGKTVQVLRGGHENRGCSFVGPQSLMSWGDRSLMFWEMPEGKGKAPTEEEFARLITQLGSEEYSHREKASNALVAIGRVILPKLAAVKSKDQETVDRLVAIQERILRSLAFNITDTLAVPEDCRGDFIVHPDGKHWVTMQNGQGPQRLLVGEINKGKLKAVCFVELAIAPSSIYFEPNGTMIAGNRNGTISVYPDMLKNALTEK